MEAGHDAKIRGAEQLEHFIGFVMPDHEQDRLVVGGPMALIDLGCQVPRLVLQLAIAREAAPGRRRNLEKRETALPLRMAHQERIDGPHAVENALRVIETLDTHAQPDAVVETEARTHD